MSFRCNYVTLMLPVTHGFHALQNCARATFSSVYELLTNSFVFSAPKRRRYVNTFVTIAS